MSIFIPIPKKCNAKECSNYRTIALISNASKVMLKILQARLQQYMNHELPDVQAGLRKDRETRDQIANIHWVIRKIREFQKKTSTSALLTMTKPLTVWIITNHRTFFKRWVENSAVATGLEKVSFHSNPKERQCQRKLKLPHNCTHLTC